MFFNLASHIDKDPPIYGLNPLGLDDKSTPQTCVKEMATYYLKEIQIFQPEGPYYLGETCFGAYVAFEMAQQLHEEGKEVASLVFFDPSTLVRSNNYLKYCMSLLDRWRKQGTFISVLKNILSNRYQWMIRKFEIVDQERQELLQVMDAHFIARKSYKPYVYSGDVMLFKSNEYDQLEKEGLRFGAVSWDDMVKGEIDYHIIPGSHEEMLIGSNLLLLTNQLKDSLRKIHEKPL